MTATDAAPGQRKRRDRARIPLVSGKPVRFRWEQMLAWGLIVGTLGTCFAAGLYYAFWEVHWTFGALGISWDLKKWWDAGSWWPRWLGHWPVYRHATFRDLLEPEVFIMAIGTLLAKPASWAHRCSTLRLVTAPVILLALAIVLNTAGTWLLNFALPASATAFFAHASIGTILLGFAIGHFVLRPFWAPVGALLQGDRIDRSVAYAKKHNREPVWEKLPLMPPVIRERFADMWRKAGVPLRAAGVHRWLLAALGIIIVLVTVLGGFAKYGFAHGYVMPYFNPR